MNNKEESKLNIIGSSTCYCERTDLDSEPMSIDFGHDDTLTVLAKHDYFSSNSTHGRFLLRSVLYSILENPVKVTRFILIDSGVKLIDPSSQFSEEINAIIKQLPEVLVCSESLNEYDVEQNAVPQSALIVTASEITSELLHATNIFCIE